MICPQRTLLASKAIGKLLFCRGSVFSPLASVSCYSTQGDAKGKEERKPPKSLLTLAEQILKERGATSYAQIADRPAQRIKKLISTRSVHRVLPLSRRDRSNTIVQQTARAILLQHRRRAALSWSEKNGVPRLLPANGIGHFVLPLVRLHFSYCSHNGDSAGLRQYLRDNLAKLAEADPSVEFVVEPRWGRYPLLRAWYIGGRSKCVCVRRMTAKQVHEMFLKLRDSSGRTLVRFRQAVKSTAPAVRPLWSPFHSLNTTLKNNPLMNFVSKH